MKKKILYLYKGEERVVIPNDFYQDVTKDLAKLAFNLKQTLEEANGITESEPPVEATDVEQSQIIKENSLKTEN